MMTRSNRTTFIGSREHAAIGRVEYQVSPRARSVRISVAPFKPVQVTIPPGFPLAEAEAIVENKVDWIRKHLEIQDKKANGRTLFIPGVVFRTRSHEMNFLETEKPGLRAELKEGQINIQYSSGTDLRVEGNQAFIRKVIGRALIREGIIYLPQRTFELALQHGFRLREVKVKDMKSRWGSCSSDGRLTLNAHLMRLPDELIDLIILHELAHTLHPNHGPGFHHLLAKICPGYRALDKQLKAYSPTIF